MEAGDVCGVLEGCWAGGREVLDFSLFSNGRSLDHEVREAVLCNGELCWADMCG